ncbi:MAG: mercury resistance system periplasmic binding protein MerP [Methylococcaceae bacterium]|nr:mercury resistance system periplasmic binding protein MerP [Methylococcaceae bacterium]MCI0732926.1 mercury resistance system periplasmic binding protein MerP [Methylococcaceae bacterium]
MRFILKGLVIAWLFSSHLAFLSAGEAPASSAMALKTVTLNVRNMDCPMCRITIRKALEKVAGVKEAEVDYETKTARVTFDPAATTVEALTRATLDAGYPSALKSE